jgi:hypothetical protein
MWYIEFVDYVIANGLMQGTGTDTLTFEPNTRLSRAMLVQILYNMEGKPAVGGNAVFADVPAGSWFFDAVAWSYENGIVLGYDNGNFGPNDPVTREQMVTILYRYAQSKGYDTTASADLGKFTDAAKVNDWAVEAMQWAVGAGLVVGRDNNTIAPQDTATRAEVATIITRFCKTIVGTEMPKAPEPEAEDEENEDEEEADGDEDAE